MVMHESLDDVVRDLRRLRGSVGDPSFAQIAQRVTERRIARGTPEAAARVARTTVYDAFRLGRTRLDSGLVGEIAAALEEDEHLGTAWARRAQRARPSRDPEPSQDAASPHPSPDTGASDDVGSGAALAPAESSPAEPASPDRSAAPAQQTHLASAPRTPQETSTTSAPMPAVGSGNPHATPKGSRPGVRRRWVVPIMLVCLAVNLTGYAVVGRLPLPLYLDMVGTAMAAFMLGPWRAVVVAVLTHALGMFVGPETSLALMPVNIVGALAWGYGAHRWGMTLSPARFLALSLGTALACTLVAVPLLEIFFDAHSGHTTDGLAADFQARGLPHLSAMLSVNLFTSIADKLVSGAIALAAVSLLPASPPDAASRAEADQPLSPQPGAPQREYVQHADGYAG